MKVNGREKFDRQLAALPAAMKAEIRKALETSASETVDLMRRFAPVETGKLRASIDFTFGEAPKGALASDARAAKAESGLAVTMFAGGKQAFYARFQEFGTTNMAANPFFFPAYRLGRKRAKSRLSRSIRNGAKKAFAK